jgi:hypothetical protein
MDRAAMQIRAICAAEGALLTTANREQAVWARGRALSRAMHSWGTVRRLPGAGAVPGGGQECAADLAPGPRRRIHAERWAAADWPSADPVPAAGAVYLAGTAVRRDGPTLRRAVLARSMSTAAMAAVRAAPTAMMAICQPGMPPATIV